MEQRALLTIDLDLASLAQETANGKKQVAGLVAELKKLKDEGQENTAEYAQLEAQLKNTRAEVRQNADTLALMEKAQKSMGGSITEMRTNLSLLTRQYNSLSKEERESAEVGQKLQQQARELSDELKKLEKGVGNTSRNVGNYGDAIREALAAQGGFLGSLGSIAQNFNSLNTEGEKNVGMFGRLKGAIGGIGLVAGIGALVGGVTMATAAVSETVAEFEKLRKKINELTGSEGEELDSLTQSVSALAKTYDKDFNEVLLASNTLSRQMGISQEDALAKIKQGFLAGADAGGQLLDQVREYSTQFKDAGASADEMFLILTQSAKEGVFSDKGADVVKEFGLRIREQTKATKEALEGAFGEDFTAKLFKGLNEGSISSVEALKLVSKELSTTELTAAQTQTVIADVFGGPGEDAGLEYLKSLQNIGSSMEGVIDTSNIFVQRQMALIKSEEELAAVQNEVAKQFGGQNEVLKTLGNDTLTFLYSILIGVAGVFKEILAPLKTAWDSFVQLGESLGIVSKEFSLVKGLASLLVGIFKVLTVPMRLLYLAFGFLAQSIKDFVETTPSVKLGLMQIVDGIGSLYNFLSQAPSYLAAFWAAFKETFSNIGQLIKMALTGDFDGIKRTWANFGSNVSKAYNDAFIQEQQKAKTTKEAAIKPDLKKSLGITPEDKKAIAKAAEDRLKEELKAQEAARKAANKALDEAEESIRNRRIQHGKLAAADAEIMEDLQYAARERRIRENHKRELDLLTENYNQTRLLLTKQGIDTQGLDLEFRRNSEVLNAGADNQLAKLAREEEINAIREQYAALKLEREKQGADTVAIIEAQRVAEIEANAKWDAIEHENKLRQRDADIELKISQAQFQKQQDEEMLAWQQSVNDRKAALASNFLSIVSDNFKKHTILGKAAFVAQKMLAIGEILINARRAAALQATATQAQALAADLLVPGSGSIIRIKGAIERKLIMVEAALSAAAIATQVVQGFNEGGIFTSDGKGNIVTGPGTGTSDSVNARLSNGEAVMTAKSVQMFKPLLSYLNQLGGGRAFDKPNTSGNYFTGGVFNTVLGESTSLAAQNAQQNTATLATQIARSIQPVLIVEEVEAKLNDMQFIRTVQNQ